MTKSANKKNTAYDSVPYASFPFSQTNPASLRANAFLFGLDAPAPEKAKILELGCASGNNILSIATRYPNSECVGIDLSEVQIAQGKQNIKDLGIKNLKLEQKSILDIDASFGKFDYIICHGVFSWVPQNVQEKILQICSQNLTENGIAYVSYNTMPGWAAVRAIRDMMLYHTARFSEPTQKAQQARLLLKFLEETHQNYGKSPYSEILSNEAKLLSGQSDWYLLHDHLEENNTQLYFHQFMELAAKNNLQYLSEVTLANMYSGNLPAETAKILATSDDLVRTEQYMDFISNRRFRSTLLCHKNRILRRNVQADSIKDKFFSGNFTLPENINTAKAGERLDFKTPAGMTLSTNDAVLIEALKILANLKGANINIKNLAKEVADKLGKADEQATLNSLASNLLRCIFVGGVQLHLSEDLYVTSVSAKPKAYKLAAQQSGTQEWVTNMRQEHIKVNAFDKQLLPLLNGKNDLPKLAEALLPKFSDKSLTMNENNQPVTDEKYIEQKLPEFVASVLQRYAELAFLEG